MVSGVPRGGAMLMPRARRRDAMGRDVTNLSRHRRERTKESTYENRRTEPLDI
jgi:hypothetical protein